MKKGKVLATMLILALLVTGTVISVAAAPLKAAMVMSGLSTTAAGTHRRTKVCSSSGTSWGSKLRIQTKSLRLTKSILCETMPKKDMTLFSAMVSNMAMR